jgi:hypothetical protein
MTDPERLGRQQALLVTDGHVRDEVQVPVVVRKTAGGHDASPFSAQVGVTPVTHG